MFSTPPGKSAVAVISPTSIEGVGRRSLASTTTVLPTRDRREHRVEETLERGVLIGDHAHDPAGHGHREVEVRTGDGVGRAEDLGDLVGPTGVPDDAINGARDGGLRILRLQTLGERHVSRSVRRDATRPSPPVGRSPVRGCTPSAPHHLDWAARAATTASRTSLREPCAALARKSPCGGRHFVTATRLGTRKGAIDQ